MRIVLHLVTVFIILASSVVSHAVSESMHARMAAGALDWAAKNGRLRQALQAFPKGGDIHSHLRGAIYAESWLDWAAEDGLCVDMESLALKMKEAESCEAKGWITAEAARANEDSRRELINSMSTRSYVPTLNWSGHNDFFSTFSKIQAMPYRLGDQLAEVSKRAAHQNILYLELMETLVLPELFDLVKDVQMTGDVERDYKALMASPFGAQMPALIGHIEKQILDAHARKRKLLGCDMNSGAEGCGVEILFLHQVVREFPPAVVFAQIALGWAVMDSVPDVVGLNLVAPEDGFIALRDYSLHMRMIDYLYTNFADHNVTLHAGELTLGLVRPKQLRFHIREAIEVGHAKRIGHGVDIAYEDNSEELVKKMADEKIMVEINLTSNDTILGVKGADHPLHFYRDILVPYALSTDDEGVSRIDLTNEYMRLYREHSVPYFEMKEASRNSLTYSFLPGESLWENEACVADVEVLALPSTACRALLERSKKANLQWRLEENFQAYETNLRIPELKTKTFQ